MNVLKEILLSESKKKELIRSFQERIWNGEDYSSDPKINEVLSELAYDLDFYQPNADLRGEDPSYYGDQRLVEEINLAIKKINGIKYGR